MLGPASWQETGPGQLGEAAVLMGETRWSVDGRGRAASAGHGAGIAVGNPVRAEAIVETGGDLRRRWRWLEQADVNLTITKAVARHLRLTAGTSMEGSGWVGSGTRWLGSACPWKAGFLRRREGASQSLGFVRFCCPGDGRSLEWVPQWLLANGSDSRLLLESQSSSRCRLVGSSCGDLPHPRENPAFHPDWS